MSHQTCLCCAAAAASEMTRGIDVAAERQTESRASRHLDRVLHHDREHIESRPARTVKHQKTIGHSRRLGTIKPAKAERVRNQVRQTHQAMARFSGALGIDQMTNRLARRLGRITAR